MKQSYSVFLVAALLSSIIFLSGCAYKAESTQVPYNEIIKQDVENILKEQNLTGEVTANLKYPGEYNDIFIVKISSDEFENLKYNEMMNFFSEVHEGAKNGRNIAVTIIVNSNNKYYEYATEDLFNYFIERNGERWDGKNNVTNSNPPPSSSSQDDCIHSTVGITYIVYTSSTEGTVDTISATWENDNGGTEQGDYSVPFCRNYTNFSSGDSLYVSAQITTPSSNAGTIDCKIYQDNYLIAQSEASGFASIATCSGFMK